MSVHIPFRNPPAAIDERAIQRGIDPVGRQPNDRRKQLLEAVLGIARNPERLVREKTGVEVQGITDTGGEDT